MFFKEMEKNADSFYGDKKVVQSTTFNAGECWFAQLAIQQRKKKPTKY